MTAMTVSVTTELSLILPLHFFLASMPAQRVRQAQGAIKPAFHPYKLRPSRKYTRENMARDQPAEKLKYKKTSQEQALHILDNKELKNIPVQQLRRLAGVC